MWICICALEERRKILCTREQEPERVSRREKEQASERLTHIRMHAHTHTRSLYIFVLNMTIDVTHAPMYKIDATNTRKNRPETF